MGTIPFKGIKLMQARDIQRGDVIIYRDPQNYEYKRGIVYSSIVNNQLGQTIGFRVLPAETVLKGKVSASRYECLEKHPASIVEQLKGSKHLHKAVVLFSLQSVANVPQMTGVDTKGEIAVIGSFNGSPFMKELFQRVENLYKEGRLYIDGKPTTPDTKIKIVPPRVADRDRSDNSAARREAFEAMAKENANMGGTTVGKKLEEKVKDLSLKAAFEGGHISQRTAAFLVDAKMPATGKAPETLMDAYEIVSKNPESLTAIFGLGKKGKLYQSIISEVTEAVQKLTPPTPKQS